MGALATSDSENRFYNAKGQEARRVVDYKLRTGSLGGYPRADAISNENFEVKIGHPAFFTS